MIILTKKKINAKLIKFQNEYGKMLGKEAWMKWKEENNVRQSR